MKLQKGLGLNMLKLTATITSFLFFLVTTSVSAQELVSTSSDTPPIYTFIKKGDIAPFDGTLFSPKATAEILRESSDDDLRCKIKIDREVAKTLATCKLELGLIETMLESERWRNKITIEQKNLEIKQLSELADDGKYNWLWATGGVVGGILLTLGTVYVVTGITR